MWISSIFIAISFLLVQFKFVNFAINYLDFWYANIDQYILALQSVFFLYWLCILEMSIHDAIVVKRQTPKT